jgi:riboflavin kinase/FMN adenylyltransferase
MSLDVVEPLVLAGEFVSSSRVRNLLTEGRVDVAREMLTEPYRIRGMVVHGAGRGVKLGFGTANLSAVDTLLPREGVYAGRGFVADRRMAAAIHIGPNPTFEEQQAKVEIHLVGWDGGVLYGEPLEVDFLQPLREVRTFSGIDELKSQLTADVQAARAAFQQYELADKLALDMPEGRIA